MARNRIHRSAVAVEGARAAFLSAMADTASAGRSVMDRTRFMLPDGSEAEAAALADIAAEFGRATAVATVRLQAALAVLEDEGGIASVRLAAEREIERLTGRDGRACDE